MVSLVFVEVLADISRVLNRVADRNVRRIIGSDERCQLLTERVAARRGDVFYLAAVLLAFKYKALLGTLLVVMNVVISEVLDSPRVSVRSVPGGFDLLCVLVSVGVFVRVGGGSCRCTGRQTGCAAYRSAFIAFGALYPFSLFKPVFRGSLMKICYTVDIEGVLYMVFQQQFQSADQPEKNHAACAVYPTGEDGNYPLHCHSYYEISTSSAASATRS